MKSHGNHQNLHTLTLCSSTVILQTLLFLSDLFSNLHVADQIENENGGYSIQRTEFQDYMSFDNQRFDTQVSATSDREAPPIMHQHLISPHNACLINSAHHTACSYSSGCLRGAYAGLGALVDDALMNIHDHLDFFLHV